MLGDQANPPLQVDRIIAYELELRGSHGMQAHRYPAMLGMILAGRVSPGDLISHRISLGEAPAALMQLPHTTQRGITVITDFG
jgi:alcohol dehydrogenase